EDTAAATEFQAQKKKYEELRVKNGGYLTFKQDIEWMKIQSAEDARKKKRKRDILKELEETGQAELGLFSDDTEPIKVVNEEDSDSDDQDDVENHPRKRRRPELPRKEPKRMTLREAELMSMNVALDATSDVPKKKNKGYQSSTRPSSPDSSKGKCRNKSKLSRSTMSSSSKVSKSKKKKGPRKGTEEARQWEQSVKQVSSLFTGDVFREQARQDAAEQPTFAATNKKDALKELIASVPLDDKRAARSDMSALLAATKDLDGHGSAKPKDGLWLVKGMKTALKPYQLMGTAFMRRRENAGEEPRGGLVADQMGLGKTLMMLANIINGRAPKGSPVKTTLLVASPNLLTQWAREIQAHTDEKLKLSVLRYGYGTRIESNRGHDILASHDIILTTYNEVMRSYPKNEPPAELQTAEEKQAWWKEKFEENRGVLHRMMFYRIVLDEAQVIKNHTSRTSIACRGLMAQHKWALSGTPILNNLTELYPYFKFLGVPHTGSFKIFKHNYCDASDPDNTERLLIRLSQFMIRRTHSDVLFGAPILKLPKATPLTHWCEFNQVERNVYDIVQKRFALTINGMSKKGELDKSYSNILVMLLRLRQMTAHILMLQFFMRDLLEREDIQRIREDAEPGPEPEHEPEDEQPREEYFSDGIDAQLNLLMGRDRNANANTNGHGHGNEDDLHEEPRTRGDPNSGNKFGKEYDYAPYLKSLTAGEHWNRIKEKSKCGSCGQSPPTDPWITGCHHIFCRGCLEEMQVVAAEDSLEHASCKLCGNIFTHSMRCRDVEDEDESLEFGLGPMTRSKAKKGGEERVRPDREDIKDNWISLGGRNVLPSAKTVAIKAQVLNWLQENPNVKIIIYTQFLAMIRILGKVCHEEDWGYCEYHGKQSFTARDRAISEFADNPEKILLASLRAGGLGLNLTMASRVIVIDPWWNHAAEQQAFCRVFRIGQHETTFMTRFCVKNTVDERLIQMQETKQEEIDSVMEDGGSTLSKLNIRDLMRLFGPVADDDNGKPFILV
ncbi:hypothetical protein GQ43DRAFT_347720, partial [Delitschia confertaspora ATCC 74209]